MRVIFLDIDGVLAPWRGTIEPEVVAQLDLIVARTGAVVVITSAWRETLSVRSIAATLERAGFHGVVYGTVPVLPRDTRADEIERWLVAHPETRSFVILDDALIESAELSERLVRTDAEVGLTREDAETAVALLGEEEREPSAY